MIPCLLPPIRLIIESLSGTNSIGTMPCQREEEACRDEAGEARFSIGIGSGSGIGVGTTLLFIATTDVVVTAVVGGGGVCNTIINDDWRLVGDDHFFVADQYKMMII